jgi:RNA polymerase sigma-70 factor (ECF subfamily)
MTTTAPFAPVNPIWERFMPLMHQETEPADASDPNSIDVRLMLRVKEGDIPAFEELVGRHQHAIVGTVAKMLGSANDAEDVAQQVFVRIWKSAHRYEPTAKFTTWMFTITRNLVFNESRKRTRRSEVSVEEREEDFHQTLVEKNTVEPDINALHNELLDAIETCIQSLPEKQRLAVVLRRYEDMPYEEIGKILDLTLPAVKSLLFRARTQMKEDLQKYLDGN